jgi:hypothetical protein
MLYRPVFVYLFLPIDLALYRLNYDPCPYVWYSQKRDNLWRGHEECALYRHSCCRCILGLLTGKLVWISIFWTYVDAALAALAALHNRTRAIYFASKFLCAFQRLWLPDLIRKLISFVIPTLRSAVKPFGLRHLLWFCYREGSFLALTVQSLNDVSKIDHPKSFSLSHSWPCISLLHTHTTHVILQSSSSHDFARGVVCKTKG